MTEVAGRSMSSGAPVRERWIAAIVERWDLFWHSRAPAFNLGVFRILFACALLLEVETTRRRSVLAIEGGFHLPYFSFLSLVSEETYQLLHHVQYPLCLLLAIGLLARVSCGALLVIQGWVFFADQLNFRNHPYFFLLLLVFLMLAPCDDALSVRALWKRTPLLGGERPVAMQRLIQVQLSIVYLAAALHKLHAAFLEGRVLAHILPIELANDMSSPILALLGAPFVGALRSFLATPSNMMWPSILTVAVEMFLTFGLWFRKTRAAAIVTGVGFHALIAVMMNIPVFSLACVAVYVLFVEWKLTSSSPSAPSSLPKRAES